ncbi:7754_t:CDS:2, partial [Scutellospora calospora]
YFLENVERLSQTFSRSSSMQVENSSVSSSVERSTDEEPPPSYLEAISQTQNNIRAENITSRLETENQNIEVHQMNIELLSRQVEVEVKQEVFNNHLDLVKRQFLEFIDSVRMK